MKEAQITFTNAKSYRDFCEVPKKAKTPWGGMNEYIP